MEFKDLTNSQWESIATYYSSADRWKVQFKQLLDHRITQHCPMRPQKCYQRKGAMALVHMHHSGMA